MTPPSRPLRILYLVHDLNDAAVARRVAMLRRGGGEVELAGFYRGERPAESLDGVTAVSLGRSYDAQFARRGLSVVGAVAKAGALARKFAPPDVIVARNLEMLAIGDRIAGHFPSSPTLVYECLDVHRLMLDDGLKGRVMRALEKPLLARARLLIVSSPAFVEHYFQSRQGFSGQWLLVENKAPAGLTPPARVAHGQPWRIGWFGMLRCARSLALLSELAGRLEGRVEVVLAGKPARTEFADFDAAVAAAPHVQYRGPYRPEDLPALYGSVDLAWAIDYFEEGLNSSWLLPNRLYEASANGAAPIALAQVETGRWLARHDAGLRIGDPSDLFAFFGTLDAEGLAALLARVAAIPRADLMFDDADCLALVRALQAVALSHDR